MPEKTEPNAVSEQEPVKERSLTADEKAILERAKRIHSWARMQRAIPEPTNYFKQRRFN
jgi:hypothetical protein